MSADAPKTDVGTSATEPQAAMNAGGHHSSPAAEHTEVAQQAQTFLAQNSPTPKPGGLGVAATDGRHAAAEVLSHSPSQAETSTIAITPGEETGQESSPEPMPKADVTAPPTEIQQLTSEVPQPAPPDAAAASPITPGSGAGQTDASSLMSAADAAAPDAMEHDTQLEYDSMVLLSKLEQLMIRLGDSAVQKSMPLTAAALIELTNHLIEFSESLSIAENQRLSLQTLLERDAQNYAQLQPQHAHNGRLTFEDFADSSLVQHPDTFQQFVNDLLRIVNIYLSASAKAFRAPRIGEQWRTLYTGFFVNLSKTIRDAHANQKQ